MKNLFHYNAEYLPEAKCEDVLRNWGITHYQLREALEEYFRGRIVMGRKSNKEPKPHWSWRLTAPLWCIVYIIFLLLVCPVNWVATGSFGLSEKSLSFRLLKPWYNKLFP